MNKVIVFQINRIGASILSLIPHPFSFIAGNERITQRGKGKESTIKSAKNPLALVDESKNVKKQDGKRTTLNVVEVDKASLQDSPVYSGGNLGRNRVKGKVKEFVKMFNQEAPPKPNDNIDS